MFGRRVVHFLIGDMNVNSVKVTNIDLKIGDNDINENLVLGVSRKAILKPNTHKINTMARPSTPPPLTDAKPAKITLQQREID